eukprot:gb/GFBE01023852.1/.p1 GENE.gb/GFBE01023852.1/~~gb/GFBE01023852.1/.p1  ORF type:complete len:164 (+),score=37.41 gb/GFBE01023852.1/:1-492(+)
MIQSGCPFSRDPKARRSGTGGPKPGTTFKNLKSGAIETRNDRGNINDEFEAEISNKKGTLSMANTGDDNSGGSQFFMNVMNNEFLDWFSRGKSQHPVFGKAADEASFDVMLAISKVATVEDVPEVPVRINSVTVALAVAEPDPRSSGLSPKRVKKEPESADPA